MIIKASEKGQALILITLAAVGLFAFAALAIDGSMAFSDKRHAQNAADTAALAGALKYTRGGDTTAINDIAQERTTSNGYDNGDSNDVTIMVTDVPSGECPGGTPGKDVTVTINSFVKTTFAKVIGREIIENAVTATSRACGFYYEPLFNGNAIVGLKPSTSPCGFNSGESESAKWKVKGGGIFSNGCAESKNTGSVDLTGECVSSVGGASGFTCENEGVKPFKYPEDVLKIMPPNPCDGTPGDIGILVDDDDPPTFSDGVYCVSDMDDFDGKDIVLNNATLYVTDTDFNLKFAGGGGFSGTPTQAGSYPGSDDYDNYYMIIAMKYNPVTLQPDPCEDFNDNDAQVIQFRGNGGGTFTGTVLAPSACLDLRGNGDSDGIHSQIIAYIVSSNGNAGGGNDPNDQVYINYEEEENHIVPVFPSLTVLK
jgi:Flp pilus assembly protein TadG